MKSAARKADVGIRQRRLDGGKGILHHLDETGAARMVDVGAKEPTARHAVARAVVRMSPATAAAVAAGDAPKGDVLGTARIAGIQAAKRTAELIPLCHPLALDHVDVTATIARRLRGARGDAPRSRRVPAWRWRR